MTEQTEQYEAFEGNVAGPRLYAKLAAVAGALTGVELDGHNKQLNYSYAKPATIMRTVKPHLAEHKLVIIPQLVGVVKERSGSKTQSGAENVLTRVDMSFLIADGETGETLVVPWCGEGQDWSDKGIAKAQTICVRTFLLNLFQIPAGEDDTDPEAGSAHTQTHTAPSAASPAPAQKAKQNGRYPFLPPSGEPTTQKAVQMGFVDHARKRMVEVLEIDDRKQNELMSVLLKGKRSKDAQPEELMDAWDRLVALKSRSDVDRLVEKSQETVQQGAGEHAAPA